MQDVVNLMRRDVRVDPVASTVKSERGDADAFYVRFTYTDRAIATKVTERLGSLFVDLNAKDRGQLAQATNDFLESQLSETRRQLEEQERKLEVFRTEMRAGCRRSSSPTCRRSRTRSSASRRKWRLSLATETAS